MNRKLLLVPVAVIVGGAILVTTLGRRRDNGRLLISGNIEVVKVEASFRVPGKVRLRPVEEGQAVTEGQLLAQLETGDLEQQVAIRRAERDAVQAALRAAERGSRVEEIEASRQALEQAQAELHRLEPDEARLRGLKTQGIVSSRDYETVQAALRAAQARVTQAQQQFSLVRQGPRPEDRDLARARADQASQALLLAETQLAYGTLKAPCPGVVLSKNIEPNEYVAPGTAVVTLADLSKVWLRAYLEESDLGRVKVGQKAWVVSDSFPGRKFEGRVSFVSSEAEFTPKSVQTRKERTKLVYRIKVDLDNPGHDLKPGMPVDGEIELSSK